MLSATNDHLTKEAKNIMPMHRFNKITEPYKHVLPVVMDPQPSNSHKNVILFKSIHIVFYSNILHKLS